MLLSGSATNSRVITPEEKQLRLTESLSFINTKQWYCAYTLLRPLEQNTKDICILYNLGLCYFQVDEFDRAILVLQQALIFSQSQTPSPRIDDAVKQKLLQQEYQSENYLLAITPLLVQIDPELVQQRLQRLLVDIYVKKCCWQEILNLARQLNNHYPNVQKAQQLAYHSLKDVKNSG